MEYTENKIIEILLEHGYVTKEEIKQIQEYAISHRDEVMPSLMSQWIVSTDIIAQAIAEHLKVDYIDLKSHEAPDEVFHKLPEETARKHRVVVFAEDDNTVSVASDDPDNKAMISEIKRAFPRKKVEVSFDMSSGIDDMLKRYDPSLQEIMDRIQEKGEHIAPEMLNAIFSNAITIYVSDIHFEPYAKKVLVRFRIDGVLRDVAHMPRSIYDNVLNRIKVLSWIRLDLHAQTQDGSLQYKEWDVKVDLRTSIIPTIEWEKVVMRVLSSYVKWLGLDEIGFSKKHQEVMTEAANKPFGMIIVTWPTGSGKSTTLYSLLKILNVEDVNITTIEDPVEYKMKWLNQIQVNGFVDLTFAKGLRSIVRQDPDIILVGEIRDEETAEIAVNASLTGHLLFSTFHTNDAPTTVPRMINMGIQPYLLASTLELVVAQRLVRKICSACKYSHVLDKKALEEEHPWFSKYFPEENLTLFAGKGCRHCWGSGFQWRSAIFEFLKISNAMEDLINTTPSTQEIWDLAKSEWATSLFEDGIEKVKNGITTLNELLRVAEPPKKKKKLDTPNETNE